MDHRTMVGGLWEEVGALQCDFLIRYGLRPHHYLLDVGCGCLRGGVHFVRFLDAGHYYGLDANAELLAAGFDVELPAAGLQGRLSRDHLRHTPSFDATPFGVRFDFAVAQSVFTHLRTPEIVTCLTETARVVRTGGVLLATYFEAPHHDAIGGWRHRPGGIVTWPDRDPYHYRWFEIEAWVAGLPWRAERIGEWGHPRAQMMAAFVRE